MPTYAYACTACEHRFEVRQSFSDSALSECPECTGTVRKLFNTVGIVFKGSGFYATDSRASGTKAADGSGSSGSGDKPSADKPAAEKKNAAAAGDKKSAPATSSTPSGSAA